MLPLSEFISKKQQDNFHSPDAGIISQKFIGVPVFIYGQERAGFSNHSFLTGCPVLGVGRTLSRAKLYLTADHAPVPLETSSDEGGHPLFGELYLVPPETLFLLDIHFANKVSFQRRKIFVKYHALEQATTKEKTYRFSPAWTYFGDSRYWNMLYAMNPLTALPVFRGHDGINYHVFTKSDDQPNRSAKAY